MKIFKISREDGAWYDENDGFVIAASSEAEVRKIASDHAADEGAAVWFDPQESTCQVIGEALPNQSSEVILCDFHAG